MIIKALIEIEVDPKEVSNPGHFLEKEVLTYRLDRRGSLEPRPSTDKPNAYASQEMRPVDEIDPIKGKKPLFVLTVTSVEAK